MYMKGEISHDWCGNVLTAFNRVQQDIDGHLETIICEEMQCDLTDLREYLNTKRKPQNNLDRVRHMDAEDLAALCENGCPPDWDCPDYADRCSKEKGIKKTCQICWKDWLLRSADNEMH